LQEDLDHTRGKEGKSISKKKTLRGQEGGVFDLLKGTVPKRKKKKKSKMICKEGGGGSPGGSRDGKVLLFRTGRLGRECRTWSGTSCTRGQTRQK